MSEEEAIKILNTYKGNLSQQKKNPKITKAIDRIIDALEEKNIFLNLYNKEKEKNKALKEGLKYRINYCKLLEKELYANGVNYEFEKTESEKQFLEE